MKNIFLLLLVSLPTISFNKYKKIRKICIYEVEFLATTPVRVLCNNFFQSFGSQIDSFDVTKDQDKILKMLETSINENENIEVDTRAKILIYYSTGEVDEYCFGNFSHCMKNGKNKVLNKDYILNYIDSIANR